jgi:hypothetical protein
MIAMFIRQLVGGEWQVRGWVRRQSIPFPEKQEEVNEGSDVCVVQPDLRQVRGRRTHRLELIVSFRSRWLRIRHKG